MHDQDQDLKLQYINDLIDSKNQLCMLLEKAAGSTGIGEAGEGGAGAKYIYIYIFFLTYHLILSILYINKI